jgi:hypothetical protein
MYLTCLVDDNSKRNRKGTPPSSLNTTQDKKQDKSKTKARQKQDNKKQQLKKTTFHNQNCTPCAYESCQ